MQNVRPTDLEPAGEQISPVSGAITGSLLSPRRRCCPARNRPTMLTLQFGSSEPLSPGMRLRNS